MRFASPNTAQQMRSRDSKARLRRARSPVAVPGVVMHKVRKQCLRRESATMPGNNGGLTRNEVHVRRGRVGNDIDSWCSRCAHSGRRALIPEPMALPRILNPSGADLHKAPIEARERARAPPSANGRGLEETVAKSCLSLKSPKEAAAPEVRAPTALPEG